jgi:hypothetical protein
MGTLMACVQGLRAIMVMCICNYLPALHNFPAVVPAVLALDCDVLVAFE